MKSLFDDVSELLKKREITRLIEARNLGLEEAARILDDYMKKYKGKDRRGGLRTIGQEVIYIVSSLAEAIRTKKQETE